MDNRIEVFTDQYFDNLPPLIQEFHSTYLQTKLIQLDYDTLLKTLTDLTQTTPENMFIVISNNRCVGLLAGQEIHNRINSDKIYQEFFWYVEPGHGTAGFKLVREAENDLKSRGFSSIIMSVIQSDKAAKIKRVYNRMGYRPLEEHYMRRL